MSKPATLLLIAIFVLSNLVMVGSGFAQSMSKPSVPEFTLKLVAHPYDVPSTYEIDPYTGEKIITSYGYREENKSIEVTIKNQPFTSTLDSSGNYTSLFYNVRYKGHYSDEWTPSEQSLSTIFYNASNSDYTVISISLLKIGSVSIDGEIDFQVRALIGYSIAKAYGSILPPEMMIYHEFIGQAGDWSNTQTISNSESQSSSPEPTIPTSPSQMPDEEPELSEQDVILGIAITVAVLVAGLGLLVYLVKRK